MSETILVNSNTVLRLGVFASPSTMKTAGLFFFSLLFLLLFCILFLFRGHKIPRRTHMMKIKRLIKDSGIIFLTGGTHLGVCYLYEHSANMWGRFAHSVSACSRDIFVCASPSRMSQQTWRENLAFFWFSLVPQVRWLWLLAPVY